VYFFLPFITKGMIRPGADAARAVADTAKAVAAATPPTMAALGLFTWPLAITVLGFFLTGFIFYASLYAAAGSMVNSEQEAHRRRCR